MPLVDDPTLVFTFDNIHIEPQSFPIVSEIVSYKYQSEHDLLFSDFSQVGNNAVSIVLYSFFSIMERNNLRDYITSLPSDWPYSYNVNYPCDDDNYPFVKPADLQYYVFTEASQVVGNVKLYDLFSYVYLTGNVYSGTLYSVNELSQNVISHLENTLVMSATNYGRTCLPYINVTIDKYVPYDSRLYFEHVLNKEIPKFTGYIIGYDTNQVQISVKEPLTSDESIKLNNVVGNLNIHTEKDLFYFPDPIDLDNFNKNIYTNFSQPSNLSTYDVLYVAEKIYEVDASKNYCRKNYIASSIKLNSLQKTSLIHTIYQYNPATIY